MRVSDRFLQRGLASAVKRGRLAVTTSCGADFEVGDGTGELVAIRFHDTGAQWGFLLDPDMRVGELFMDGRLTTAPGRIYDVMFLLIQDSRARPKPWFLRKIDATRYAFQNVALWNTLTRSKRNVEHHYDLDARLYDLFLDSDRQYSCAYFETPDATLDEAQLAKKRHIAAKLFIKPGNRVLDIGCGWGGLVRFLAGEAGAGDVYGITLSEEQIAYAKARSDVKALGGRATFAIEDYRNVRGRFDRIVSVGMFEHVGRNHYQSFFNKCASLLADDGVMLLHTIGSSDGPGYVAPWVTKYIFPGGAIPGLPDIAGAAAKARLIVTDVEVLQLHYALTLRHWRERFIARRAEALALYDERFCLMWEFYLASAEAAFRCEALVVYQVQLSKAIGIIPMTRGYIGEREGGYRSV